MWLSMEVGINMWGGNSWLTGKLKLKSKGADDATKFPNLIKTAEDLPDQHS